MMPGGSPLAAMPMAASPPVPERVLGGGESGARGILTPTESDRGTMTATASGARGYIAAVPS